MVEAEERNTLGWVLLLKSSIFWIYTFIANYNVEMNFSTNYMWVQLNYAFATHKDILVS